MNEHVIVIHPDGTVKTLYTDKFDLREFGPLHVERASNVEWDEDLGGWTVEFPDGMYLCRQRERDELIAAREDVENGVFLMSWKIREDALAAEVAYLNARL